MSCSTSIVNTKNKTSAEEEKEEEEEDKKQKRAVGEESDRTSIVKLLMTPIRHMTTRPVPSFDFSTLNLHFSKSNCVRVRSHMSRQ